MKRRRWAVSALVLGPVTSQNVHAIMGFEVVRDMV